MAKEKRTEKPNAFLLIEVKKSVPRKRIVPLKEKTKKTITDKGTTTTETSQHKMRLYVNMMPVLASTKEPEEEEEEEEEGQEREEGDVCKMKSQKKQENSSKKDTSVSHSLEQKHNPSDSSSGSAPENSTETKHTLNPQFVLPPITKPTQTFCDSKKSQRCPTSLPAGRLCQQETASQSDSCDAQVSDCRPWRDNPLFSATRSPRFHLPEITLSSLEAMLQTVTLRLRKRRGCDELLWRQVQCDHLFLGDGQQDGNLAYIKTNTVTSAATCTVNRQMSLPPLYSAPKAPLILTMTKKNVLTSNMLQ